MSRARSGLFRPLPGPNFGFPTEAFWFRVPVVDGRRDGHGGLLIRKCRAATSSTCACRRPTAASGTRARAVDRRHFPERMLCKAQECLVSGGDRTLLVIDLDRFKKTSDTKGDLAGGECLRQVGGGLEAKADQAAAERPARETKGS